MSGSPLLQLIRGLTLLLRDVDDGNDDVDESRYGAGLRCLDAEEEVVAEEEVEDAVEVVVEVEEDDDDDADGTAAAPGLTRLLDLATGVSVVPTVVEPLGAFPGKLLLGRPAPAVAFLFDGRPPLLGALKKDLRLHWSDGGLLFVKLYAFFFVGICTERRTMRCCCCCGAWRGVSCRALLLIVELVVQVFKFFKFK